MIRSTVGLRSGEAIPVLGQGTWRMGEDRKRRDEDIAALRLGLDLGMTLIDTAEMYGDGGAERVVGEAIAGRRGEVFLVSKVLPAHATRRGTIDACHGSLKRLRVEQLDLYLLHWRESVPTAETLEGFEALVRAGDIRYWGVSNFDTSDMAELLQFRAGSAVTTDQVLYNLARRGIEFELLPWCLERQIPIMALYTALFAHLLRHVVGMPTAHGVRGRSGNRRGRTRRRRQNTGETRRPRGAAIRIDSRCLRHAANLGSGPNADCPGP